MTLIFITLYCLGIAIILYLFRQKTLIPITCGIFVIVSLIIFLCFRINNYSDTEYLSYKVKQVEWTEKWDEWIDETCEECVERDSTGCIKWEEYDCSYKKTHDEYFLAKTENNHSVSISKETYLHFKKLWNNNHFVDMKRDYYRIDGDRYYSNFDGNEDHFFLYTRKTSYTNYLIKNSESVFGIKDFTSQELKEIKDKKIKLFDYPTMQWKDMNINPIMSEITLPYSDIQRFKKLNWKHGNNKQIQIFVCIFNNKPAYYNDYQLKHIKGCNKNELYIIMSVDKNKQIQWYSVNSWTDDKALDTKIKYYLEENKNLNLKELANNIDQNIHHWKRKKGSDYKYLANKYKAENESKAMKGYNITFVIILFISAIFYIVTLVEQRKSLK